MEQVLIFLYANNFFQMANYLGAIMLLLYIWNRRFVVLLPLNREFFVLVFASLSYLLLYVRNYGRPETSTLVLRYFMPFILFYLGMMHVEGKEDKLVKLSMCAALGTFFHGLMNILKNRNLDILSVASRQYQDVYGGAISGTLQNLLFLLPCSLLAVFVFGVKNKSKWLGIMMALTGVFGSIANASRTMIVVTVIIFAGMTFLYLWMNGSFSSTVVRWLGFVIAIVTAVLLILWLDLFSVYEWFSQTALGRRSTISASGHTVVDNIRWTYALDILKMLPSNLLGGINYSNYAHNLWIDVAKEAGIIPFVLYILFFVDVWATAIKCYFNKNLSQICRLLIVSIISACTLTFFTEPIMQGAPLIFSLFCYISGGILTISSEISFE